MCPRATTQSSESTFTTEATAARNRDKRPEITGGNNWGACGGQSGSRPLGLPLGAPTRLCPAPGSPGGPSGGTGWESLQ